MTWRSTSWAGKQPPHPALACQPECTICEYMMTLQQRSFHAMNLYQDSSTYLWVRSATAHLQSL